MKILLNKAFLQLTGTHNFFTGFLNVSSIASEPCIDGLVFGRKELVLENLVENHGDVRAVTASDEACDKGGQGGDRFGAVHPTFLNYPAKPFPTTFVENPMEILAIASFVVSVWALVVNRIQTKPSSTFTREAAFQLVVRFREEWDLARVRNDQVELAILMNRGYIAMRRYQSEMRRMQVLGSPSATHEIQALGRMCRTVANRIASNRVSTRDWPELSGQIGHQLRSTILTLKPQ